MLNLLDCEDKMAELEFLTQSSFTTHPAIPAVREPAAECPDIEAICKAVNEYTSNIFSGDASIEVAYDPEYGNQTFVVSIEAHGAIDELVAKSEQWHRDLHLAAQGITHLFCLSLTPLHEAD